MFKASYDNEADVPAEVKQFYKHQGGKWVFDHTKFEGLAALTNPALEANRNDWQNQAMTARAALTETQTKLATAEAQAGLKAAPGSVVLSEADAKVWNQLNQLGKVDTIVQRFNDFPALESKIKLAEEIAAMESLAKETGLNFEALKQELPLRGKNIKLSQKPVEVVENGKTVVKQVAYATIRTKQADGSFAVTEEPFLEHIKKAGWPDYVQTALTAQSKTNGAQGTTPAVTPLIKPIVPQTGPSNPAATLGALPNTGVQIDNAALVAKYNAQRGVKPPEQPGQGAAAA